MASGRRPDMAVVSETLPHAGAVLTPPESNTFPVAMSANFAKEVVVSAYSKSPTAYSDCPVPPFVAGSVPVTPADKLTCDHVGAADAPPDVKTYPLAP